MTKREQLWNEKGKQGELKDLIFIGCQDHVLNLMSSDLERHLVEKQPNLCIGDKHRATDVVQFLVTKV